ncbi:Uncharacterized protein APZ42_025207 [Daphnia magna]|uniref:ZSWIM1/3 RNaseH-like domain-containing protein n=1 Tax=Daphnia magna TaxID=35525 RepID=A0A164TCG3_9CRUS|nr:Uncharacterized protein APZ42_025207 [Daphnia magna]
MGLLCQNLLLARGFHMALVSKFAITPWKPEGRYYPWASCYPVDARRLLFMQISVTPWIAFIYYAISYSDINKQHGMKGRHADEWKDVVYYLCGLQNDENNVFKVLHDADEEVAAIFVQLHTVMIGSFFSRQMDGTYSTNRAGFALYHLLIEDNNGKSQPVAVFFIREETTEAISECLKVFAGNNDVVEVRIHSFK